VFAECEQVKGEKIMSTRKVTVDNGSSTKEFETSNATNDTQAAFLAGVNYAAELFIMAYAVGALEVMLNLASPEDTIGALIDTAEQETVTVAVLKDAPASTVPDGYGFGI
jgi:hypothetical protein